MIIPEKKKEIAARLKEALLAEHLYNAQAAKCLNLIPNYITMMLNHRMWDHCPAKAWTRTEEALSQGKIAEFKIPEGEKIVDGVKAYKKKGNALITATEPESLKVQNVAIGRTIMRDGALAYENNENPVISERQQYIDPITQEPIPHEVLEPTKKEPDSDIKKINCTMPGAELVNLISKAGSDFSKVITTPETNRMIVSLDIEINLIVNGKKVQIA